MSVRRFTGSFADRPRTADRPRQGAGSRRAALAVLGGIALGPPLPAKALAADQTLPRPDSWRALLLEGAATGQPVVVLFSTPGCAYCRFVRRDHLRHLIPARRSGVRVVELSLSDRRPFNGDDVHANGVGARPPAAGSPAAASPAALAASLGIRFAPTVAFFGPDGELAERLVGYASADFYGAYLDQRIATATAALGQAQARGKATAEG